MNDTITYIRLLAPSATSSRFTLEYVTMPPSVVSRVPVAPLDRRGLECPVVFHHTINRDPAVACGRNCAGFFAATVLASLLYAVAGCRRGKGR